MVWSVCSYGDVGELRARKSQPVVYPGVRIDVQKPQAENPDDPVLMDLVTTPASDLDPHISPEAAAFQAPRVASERGMTESEVRTLIEKHTEDRQLGFLGERRVNVLELNLDLDAVHPLR